VSIDTTKLLAPETVWHTSRPLAQPAEKPASMAPATAAAATGSASGSGSSERSRVPRLLAEKRQKDRR
jgi:hypothetical protein